MKITIYGCGYVGLVTGACLSDVGNEVLCVDTDEARVQALQKGEVPIHEPRLAAIIKRNLDAGRLNFAMNSVEAVHHGEIQFICVGTPPLADGSADLRYVLEVARFIGRHMEQFRVVVNKSTVPVGTADQVSKAIAGELMNREVSLDYNVASNPEFLKEGDAINDFMKPDRIIVGANDSRSKELLAQVYAPFNRNHERIISMDVRSAELTKYAANAMLATKISFMNEMANVAEHVGADIEKVRLGIGSDSRIGYSFIYPGCGYGGSCFPKDVRAICQAARNQGYEPQILPAVDVINESQKKVLFSKIQRRFGDLTGKTIAVWGLAFKPNTDDVREASSLVLIRALLAAGANVCAHDPEAMKAARMALGDELNLEFCPDAYDSLKGADALAIVTEWKEFRCPDFERIKAAMKTKVIFDGRNLFEPAFMAEVGIEYHSIGRILAGVGE